MADIVHLNPKHPLVGTWLPADGFSSVEITISKQGDAFTVTGVDKSDGESLRISEIDWDGLTLRFVSRVPSTGHRVRYAMRLPTGSPSIIEGEITLPEAWTRVSTGS